MGKKKISVDEVVERCLKENPEKLKNIDTAVWQDYINQVVSKGDAEKLATLLESRNDIMPDSRYVNKGYRALIKPEETWTWKSINVDAMIKLKELTDAPVILSTDEIEEGYNGIARQSDVWRLHDHEVAEICGFAEPFEDIYLFHEFTDKRPVPDGARTVLQSAVLTYEIFTQIRALSHQKVDYDKIPFPFVIGPEGKKVKGKRVIRPSSDYYIMLDLLESNKFSQEAVDFMNAKMTQFINKWSYGWLQGMIEGDKRLRRAMDQFISLELLSGKQPSQMSRASSYKSFLTNPPSISAYLLLASIYDSILPVEEKEDVVTEGYKDAFSKEGEIELDYFDFKGVEKVTGVAVPAEMLSGFRGRYFEDGDPRFDSLHKLYPKMKKSRLQDVDSESAYNNLLSTSNFGSDSCKVSVFLRFVKLSGLQPSQEVADRAYLMLCEEGDEESSGIAVKMYKQLKMFPSDPEIRSWVESQVNPPNVDEMVALLNQGKSE